MKKANHILELALLLGMVVVVAVTAMTFYNNQKMKLIKLSKVTLKSQVVDK